MSIEANYAQAGPKSQEFTKKANIYSVEMVSLLRLAAQQ